MLDTGHIDMDVPPSTTYDDPRTAVQTSRGFRVQRPSKEGFLTTAPRWKNSIPSNQPLFAQPEFLNIREQIHQAQTHIRAAFGSSVIGRFSMSFPKTGPGPNAYSLPSTFPVAVRDNQTKDNPNTVFPWQGWRAKESAFKRRMVRPENGKAYN